MDNLRAMVDAKPDPAWEVSAGADKEPVLELYTDRGSISISYDTGMVYGAWLFKAKDGRPEMVTRGNFVLCQQKSMPWISGTVDRLRGIGDIPVSEDSSSTHNRETQ